MREPTPPGARTHHGDARGSEWGARLHSVASAVATVLACLLVWFALLAPTEIGRLGPGAFVRIPLEGLLVVLLVLVLPAGTQRITAVAVGLALGLLSIVKILDMGFLAALGRPFDPVVDWGYVGSAVDLLVDSVGRPAAVVSLVAAGALGVALVVLLPLSVLRLTRIVDRHTATSVGAVTALGIVWALGAVSSIRIVPDAPLASTSAAGLVYDHVRRIPDELRDRQAFAKAAVDDPFRGVRAEELLTGLRGKDVLVVFVESYGRVAVQDPVFSARVGSTLDAGTSRLRAAGFSSQSAFLTSPTYGAASWLAHATLQSGLWVDTQQRYDVLVAGDRFTLGDAFKRAGWRTVGDVPSNRKDWPQGEFYDFDTLYDARNVGYVGPEFGYATMPDQYTLAAFHRLELADPHPPVMAEIDLASSHAPWTPLPRLVDWSLVGDGTVFDPMPAQGPSTDLVWRDPERVRTAYVQSIEYTLDALISFVETYGDPDLVLVVLGDHQPAAIVSGEGANHDVPITVIARDPAVLDRIDGWGWQAGMRPGPDAPVWPMDTFRDRFLTAFGPRPPSSASGP